MLKASTALTAQSLCWQDFSLTWFTGGHSGSLHDYITLEWTDEVKRPIRSFTCRAHHEHIPDLVSLDMNIRNINTFTQHVKSNKKERTQGTNAAKWNIAVRYSYFKFLIVKKRKGDETSELIQGPPTRQRGQKQNNWSQTISHFNTWYLDQLWPCKLHTLHMWRAADWSVWSATCSLPEGVF